MATAKKTPAKASKSTAVVPWEQEMANRAARAAKTEKVIGATKRIGIRGGIMTIDDEPIEDNELRAIVLVGIHENQYYDKPFDSKNPTVPVCYAFSDPDAEGNPDDSMAPHEEAEGKQGDDNGLCANCWANQMGTADVGRGKACKNVRRLMLITEDALESAEALREAEVRSLGVPVMSTNNWAKFVNKINDEMSRPPYGVICKIKVVPDAKSQFKVTFAFEELVNFDQDLWEAMQAKVAEVSKEIVAPYPKQSDLDAQNAAPVRPQGRMAQRMAAQNAAKKPAGKPGAGKGAAPAPAGKRSKF